MGHFLSCLADWQCVRPKPWGYLTKIIKNPASRGLSPVSHVAGEPMWSPVIKQLYFLWFLYFFLFFLHSFLFWVSLQSYTQALCVNASDHLEISICLFLPDGAKTFHLIPEWLPCCIPGWAWRESLSAWFCLWLCFLLPASCQFRPGGSVLPGCSCVHSFGQSAFYKYQGFPMCQVLFQGLEMTVNHTDHTPSPGADVLAEENDLPHCLVGTFSWLWTLEKVHFPWLIKYAEPDNHRCLLEIRVQQRRALWHSTFDFMMYKIKSYSSRQRSRCCSPRTLPGGIVVSQTKQDQTLQFKSLKLAVPQFPLPLDRELVTSGVPSNPAIQGL